MEGKQDIGVLVFGFMAFGILSFHAWYGVCMHVSSIELGV